MSSIINFLGSKIFPGFVVRFIARVFVAPGAIRNTPGLDFGALSRLSNMTSILTLLDVTFAKVLERIMKLEL